MKIILKNLSPRKLAPVAVGIGIIGLVVLVRSLATNNETNGNESETAPPTSALMVDSSTSEGGSIKSENPSAAGPNDCVTIELLSHDPKRNTAIYRVASGNNNTARYEVTVGDTTTTVQSDGSNSEDIEIEYDTNQLENPVELPILVDVISSGSSEENLACEIFLSVPKHPSLDGLHFIEVDDLADRMKQAPTPNQQKALIETAVERMKALGDLYGHSVGDSTITFTPANRLHRSMVSTLGASLVDDPDGTSQTAQIFNAMNSLLVAIAQTPVELYSEIGMDYWFMVLSFRDAGLDAEADEAGTIALNGTSASLQDGIVHHEMSHLLFANRTLARQSRDIANTWNSFNPPGFRYVDSVGDTTATQDQDGFYIGFPSVYATVEWREDVAEFYQALFKHDSDDFLAEGSKADFTVHLQSDQYLRAKYGYVQEVIADVTGVSSINDSTFEAIRRMGIADVGTG